MRPQALLALSLIVALSVPVLAQCSRDEDFRDSAAVNLKDLKAQAKGQAGAPGKAVPAEKKAEPVKKTDPPAAPLCEAALKKANISASVWMVTKTAAYYYHEDCDICAELDRCELATGKLCNFRQSHRCL